MRARRVLITGAGSGIGRCFAESLAREGADLVLLDVDATGLAETTKRLPDGTRATAIVANVADRAALDQAVVEALGADGALDTVIHCAAILGPGTFTTQSPEEFERVLAIDFLGTANVVRATVPYLRKARGQIALLASTAAVHGWPGLAAYSAAKFAVVGYADGVRAELAADGVGITVVFPLLIDTPLLTRAALPPILRHGRRIPAERVVRKTLAALARRRRRVFIPGSVRLIAALHGLAPSLLDWYGRRFGIARADVPAARETAPPTRDARVA